MFAISQPLNPCVAVMRAPPPTAITRLSPMKEDRIRTNKNSPQLASIFTSKVDKIRLLDSN